MYELNHFKHILKNLKCDNLNILPLFRHLKQNARKTNGQNYRHIQDQYVLRSNMNYA